MLVGVSVVCEALLLGRTVGCVVGKLVARTGRGVGGSVEVLVGGLVAGNFCGDLVAVFVAR